MSVTVVIDNIVKNVTTTVVIDNIVKNVTTIKNNINGVWKESYNSNTYKIKLYRYGVLYDTLSVKKGSSVSLPSVATVQSTDTAHYGWTKTAGNTTRDYSATQSITPTNNMDLHAVYSYGITTASEVTVSGERTLTIPRDGSLTINAYMTIIQSSSSETTYNDLELNSSSAITVSINGVYVTGKSGRNLDLIVSVKSGDTVVIKYTTPGTSNANVSVSPTVYVDYPGYTTKTYYRSSI